MNNFYKFFDTVKEKLGIRKTSFTMIFQYLDKLKGPINIVETGCLRIKDNFNGDGQSTLLFDKYTMNREGESKVYTVDINPNATKVCKSVVSENVEVNTGDSVKYLVELMKRLKKENKKVSLFYLDSFDVDWQSSDRSAAHHLKEGLLLALLSKEARTINVSLYDAAVSSLMNQASNYLMTNEKPKRQGNLHPNIAPYGEIFLTKNKNNVTFAIGSDKHFRLLCELLGNPKLMQSEAYKTNQLRVKNRRTLAEELSTLVSEISTETLLSACLNNGIPCAEIKSIDQVLNSDSSKDLIREEIIQGKLTSRITSIAAKWK